MKKGNLIIIGGILLVFILFMYGGNKQSQKQAGAGLAATRTWTGGLTATHVLAGSTITATYTPQTMNYFGIIETIPAGWTQSKTVSPDGKVRTTADGTTITISWTAPSTAGTATFTGQYFVYPDTAYTAFATDTLQVCTNHASSACYNNNRYWYTSCSDLQDVRETCTASACGAYGANTCSGLTIQHSRTCYTAGCSADACTNTPNTQTETVTTAPNSNSGVCRWQCSSGACVQNTVADTDYNGCVQDAEFPVAVSNWKQQTGGMTDAIFPSVVTKWKTQENC